MSGAVDNVDLLRLLLESLEARFGLGTEDRADISVAGDLAQVLEMLSSAPNALRLVLSDEGDAPANEDQPETGIIKQTIAIYAAMSAGLPGKAKAGAWLGKHGKPALLVKCQDVRDHVRGLSLPAELTSERFEYTGRQAVLDTDGAPLHAYRLTFQIYTALPEPEIQPVAI
jgi:hypothetical protein